MLSHLNTVVKTIKISKALHATQGDPSHGAVTLSSQFSTVRIGRDSQCLPYEGIFVDDSTVQAKGK